MPGWQEAQFVLLSGQTSLYVKPGRISIKAVDEELYELIGTQNIQDVPMQNGDRRKHPKSLVMAHLKIMAFGSNMVLEDHKSSKGVILDLDSEPYNETMNKQPLQTIWITQQINFCDTLPKHGNYSLQHSDTTQELK